MGTPNLSLHDGPHRLAVKARRKPCLRPHSARTKLPLRFLLNTPAVSNIILGFRFIFGVPSDLFSSARSRSISDTLSREARGKLCVRDRRHVSEHEQRHWLPMVARETLKKDGAIIGSQAPLPPHVTGAINLRLLIMISTECCADRLHHRHTAPLLHSGTFDKKLLIKSSVKTDVLLRQRDKRLVGTAWEPMEKTPSGLNLN